MGILRLLNPLVLNPTAPRHRTARAAEQVARDLRAALADASAVRAAQPAARTAITPQPVAVDALLGLVDELEDDATPEVRRAQIRAELARGNVVNVDAAIRAARAWQASR